MITWKPIEGFAWYEISNTGLIRRAVPVRGAAAGSLVRQQPRSRGKSHGSSKGYVGASLTGEDGKRRSVWVHRLLAKAFLPPPDFPKAQVNHKNGVKTDNRLENLEWTTCRQNLQHAYSCGLLCCPQGEQNGRAKLKDYAVSEIRALRGFLSQRMIAEAYGVSKTTVCNIQRGKTWAHCKEEAS